MAILDTQIDSTVGGTNTAGFQWSSNVIVRKVTSSNQSLGLQLWLWWLSMPPDEVLAKQGVVSSPLVSKA